MSMSSAAERRTQQRAEARRAILDASEALLVEGGYEAFSIRRLADRCGYTAPTIYHHFGDKPGLIDALLDERFQHLLRTLRRVPEGDDAVETLRRRAHAFVRFGMRHPTHYRLLTAPRGEASEPPRSAEEAREFMEKPWRELLEAGRLRADLDSAQQSLWALLHGLVSLRTSRPDLDWSKTVVEDSIDALLRGLVPPDAALAPARERPSASPEREKR